MIGQFIVITILIVCTQASSCTDKVDCFVTKLFNFNYPKEGLYNISISLNNNYLPKAYADFNQDLISDYIALGQNNTIIVYMWNKNNIIYEPKSAYIIEQCQVQTVYTYDFNKDGYLDFIIWGQFNGQNCLRAFTQQPFQFRFIQQKTSAMTFALTTNPIYISQGIIEGLMLFSNGSRIIMQYYPIQNNFTILQWSKIFLSENDHSTIPFSSRHWNSYLDFTGDCKQDIVITNGNGQLEFWVNFGFIFKSQSKFNVNINSLTSLTFTDLDYDGGIDMILMFPNTIRMYLNSRPIQNAGMFCMSQYNIIPYDINNFEEINTTKVIIQQNVHFGDVNIDGYPDILLLLQDNETTLPYIYISLKTSPISFQPEQQYNKVFQSQLINQKIVSASFFDLLQNGIIDIFVIVQTELQQYKIISFYNNYLYQNNFFMKGYGQIGPTPTRGTILIGAAFYWLNSVDDSIRVNVNNQMIQTAYDSLQMSYVISGLGRANNYVEQFTLANHGVKQEWSPIIPNSQLAVLTTLQNPQNWVIQIFVLPTQSLIYVIIVSLIILIIMGGILLGVKYKHYRQKQKITIWMMMQ